MNLNISIKLDTPNQNGRIYPKDEIMKFIKKIKMNKRDLLIEIGHEDSIVFENPSYDNAIIGTDESGRVIYDYNKMVQCLIDEDGMEYEEACEFIDYNTIRALPYVENGPIVLMNSDIFK